MARKDPEQQIGALNAETIRLAVERDGADRALQDAKEVLGNDGPRSIYARQRAALQAQARGKPHELLEVIAKDAADAQAAVQVNTARREALTAAMLQRLSTA
jgi:hypothetical protein